MLIFDQDNDILQITDLTQTISSTHFWSLCLTELDFMLSKIVSFEQVVTPTLTLKCGGMTFKVPTNWNIMIADMHAYQLDVIPVAELPGRPFEALVYGPTISKPLVEPITVVGYDASSTFTSVVIDKKHMICHPIYSGAWICMSPSDGYNRYLKNATIGDLIDH